MTREKKFSLFSRKRFPTDISPLDDDDCRFTFVYGYRNDTGELQVWVQVCVTRLFPLRMYYYSVELIMIHENVQFSLKCDCRLKTQGFIFIALKSLLHGF